MTISRDSFDALFDGFQEEAFRLETLDDYTGSSNPENLRAFFAGEEKPADFSAAWLAQIRSNTEVGKRMYRVHILTRPLTDYLRYELGWGYRSNQTAGEEFFILDVTNRPNPLEGVPDFWMFDNATVVSMTYDSDGAFLGALPEDEPEKWQKWRDLAMSQAEPFPKWWERYGKA
ncbi:hypothetical protein C7C46_18385 [Streptomyces tateyamensis]|uniref:DUF6879 domain-containing protein n=1 Tax=Streptomyces tateyamensis TaxID=565073 RepID=A0A2V4NC12_9ACTN|nr:DUF6879 family protein [Streptomyces tateyamensis]PYC77602.1 hypothetical protein C7C46_18385 [Streptomyces tateyamensis]